MSAAVSIRSSAHYRDVFACLLLILSACATAPLRADGGKGEIQIVRLVERPGRFEPQRMTLKAGRYVFQVRNQGVAHQVTFALARIEEDGSVGERVAGAGLLHTIQDGETASSGPVELSPGKYTYRCPLNPTPHYFIRVE